ncbi:hypothetical protein ACI1US_01926 [Leucobacter sp. BZR 635]
MEFLFLGAATLSVYAATLVILRAVVYRTKLYRPMLLNIGLSVLPILLLGLAFIALLWLVPINQVLAIVVVAVLGIAWLLMLPNASYLITELNQSHRKEDDPVPLWYDIILVISLAMSGVINTIVNVFVAQMLYGVVMFDDRALSFFRPRSMILLVTVLLLIGLGMYLGRYLRLNSWDVQHPIAFVRKVVAHFRERGNALACLGFTLTYAIFIGILYLTIVTPIVTGLYDLELARQ